MKVCYTILSPHAKYMLRTNLQTSFHYKQNYNLYTQYLKMSSNCIFCKIISEEHPGEILYQDDEVVVFKDIKPASKHHYLAVPKQHIININYLNSLEHKDLLLKLISCGNKVLQDNGGSIDDVRLGFHCPPFNSIAHLHLHVISPVAEMSFLSRLIFKPNTWWFQSVDQILDKLNVDNKGSKL